jgi:hypothetical protein
MIREILDVLRNRVLASSSIHAVHCDTRISYPSLYNFAKRNANLDPKTIETLANYYGYEVKLVPSKK